MTTASQWRAARNTPSRNSASRAAPRATPPAVPRRGILHDAVYALTDPQVSHALAGSGAGAIAATIVCPLDVLKTRLQVSTLRVGGDAYASTLQSLSAIVRTEGLVGLYRGLTPTIVALLPNWAVYFTVYEGLKEFMEPRGAYPQTSWSSPHLRHMVSAAGAGVRILRHVAVGDRDLGASRGRRDADRAPYVELLAGGARPELGTPFELGVPQRPVVRGDGIQAIAWQPGLTDVAGLAQAWLESPGLFG